ncbi:MAG TPA: carbohydrate kinase [Candidatus Angelobacter sp.]|jgi:fructokinase|nr:carbohydrate kinase [Candidatus Angelobacter sp.]
MKIVSIGEVLWDILPSTQHLGGAPFNFALHAHNLGHEVCFVSAVGNDQRGNRILERMAASSLTTRFIRKTADHATGTVTVSMDSLGLPQYTIRRPAAYDFPVLTPAELDALLKPAPDWIYFGTLQQMSPSAHDLTIKLLTAAPAARRFYDVNLRADSFTPELVRTLARHAHVLKLNEQELPALRDIGGIQAYSREQFCRNCLRIFQLDAVCLTLGPQGCALLLNNEYLESHGFHVQVADTIGAGDAFSAALLHGLNTGWRAAQIADFANRVGALVASRRGGTPHWTVTEAMAL